MIDSIFFYPFVTLFIISLMSGPIGAFMVWKRISFFADSLAHATVLGGVLSFAAKINPSFGIIPTAILFALFTFFFMHKGMLLRSDLSISLIASFFVAMALFIAKATGTGFHAIEALLFGDILMVDAIDFYQIILTFITVAVWISIRWKDIFKLTISEDIAISEGININHLRLEVLIGISIFIASSMKIMGIMLLTASLIIPASIATMLFTSPLRILIGSSVIGLIISVISVSIAYNSDQSISVLSVITGFVLLVVIYIITTQK